MRPKIIPGVPRQKKGSFHDTESFKQFDSDIISQKFKVLKERLFSVNDWKKYAGENTADFKLFDSSGNPMDRKPQIGYFIRIDIPGPGQTEAKGFDWVEITIISHQSTDTSEYILMECKPSKDPKNDKGDRIAHFYDKNASSCFVISKNENQLKAAIYGRNESPNYKANFLDIIRNLLIALGGMSGFSKIQWKSLSDGLLYFN